MGYTVHVLPEHRLAVVRLAGEINGRGLIGALRAVADDPDWAPGFCVAWDARYLRVLDLMPEDLAPLSEASAELAERIGPGRSAFLARGEGDEVTVQLLNLRRRGQAGRDLRAFLRWEEAMAWLGVPASTLDVRPRPRALAEHDEGDRPGWPRTREGPPL